MALAPIYHGLISIPLVKWTFSKKSYPFLPVIFRAELIILPKG